MSAGMGGGLGLEPMTICATASKHSAVNHSATLAWHYTYISIIHLIVN